MGRGHGRTGFGRRLSMRATTLAMLVAGMLPAAALAAEPAPVKPAPARPAPIPAKPVNAASEAEVDMEFLEFLGSLDVEDKDWREYLEERPINKPAAKAEGQQVKSK